MTYLAMSLFCSPALATFDWGDACSSGEGEFEQYIGHFLDIDVGTIPAGKANVEIYLQSNEDVDIRLIDMSTGHAVISWPNGDLNGPENECTEYEGVEYCYSGYNGGGWPYGNEWIKINGISNREMKMSAFGYAAGNAVVKYSWEAAEDCVDAGEGSFAQWIARRQIVLVGDIPAGKSNIDIALEAREGRDVDVQLYDGSTKIIAWSATGDHGLMHGPTQETIEYNGLRITYSGYNGRDDNWGKEDIRITGTLENTLTVKVYGYQAGFADVTYSWGHGQNGDSCGGFTMVPNHDCLGELVCKGSGLAVDIPGKCRPQNWCESIQTAAGDCNNLVHPAVPGFWGCDQNQCQWQSGPDLPLEITLEELTSNPSAYEDQLVVITDTIYRGFPMCTKMGCPPSNPCCNHCNATMKFRHGNHQVALDGLSCSGNECNVLDNCPYQNEILVKVVGNVRLHEYGESIFINLEVVSSELATASSSETCFVSGCSSQVCSPQENVMTTCEWLEEYSCLSLTQCGNYGSNQSCGWEQNQSYVNCMAQFQ